MPKLPLKGTMFLNPSSGARLSDDELRELEATARREALEVVRVTADVDILETIRRRMSEGVRLFVAAGGDGTVNHVLQSLVQTEAHLGVIPVGTYNHFAKDLGIPLDWRAALDVALNGSSRQIDAARVNDRFFVNNVSIGLYPELVARREERGRDYPRWRARLYALYATLRKYPHVTVAVETEHHLEAIRSHVFIVSNNSYDLSRVGIDAPRESLSSGRLAVYWAPHLPRTALIRYAAHYLAGQVTAAAGFRSIQTTQLQLQSSVQRLRIGIDGELFTMAMPLTITTVPSSLLVRVLRGSESRLAPPVYSPPL
jgi:diacylglycerol kinase family enzyme